CTEKSLGKVAGRKSIGDSTLEFRGLVGEKSLHAVEVPDSVGIGIGQHVEQHPFNRRAEAEGVSALSEKRVVIGLNRIPMVKIGRTAPDSTCEIGKSANEDLRRCAARKCRASNTQIGSGC